MNILSFLFNRKQKHPDLHKEVMRIRPNGTSHEFAIDKEPEDERLISFFQGETDSYAPHSLAEITTFSDEEMEIYHDFIQWIYPTTRPSDAQPNAPIISNAFDKKIHADDCALKGYCRGCKRYLDYMGFTCNGDGNIAIKTEKQESRRPTANKFWRLPSHNFLRITRALKSLRQTGHQECSKLLYQLMMQQLENHPDHQINANTLRYWAGTQKNL